MGSDHPVFHRSHHNETYFNPRSRMGSDPRPTSSRPEAVDFNPRSRMGSDMCNARAPRHSDISIHAPAWGATDAANENQGKQRHFNPRSRMGSDDRGRKNKTCQETFQSTLPHGERQRHNGLRKRKTYFNPRSRMGSDGGKHLEEEDKNHFNPRSRMGSDVTEPQFNQIPYISIHAPAWGATM